VIYEVEPARDKLMSSVPYIFEFYRIPVIGVSSRSSIFSSNVSFIIL